MATQADVWEGMYTDAGGRPFLALTWVRPDGVKMIAPLGADSPVLRGDAWEISPAWVTEAQAVDRHGWLA
jgi:hypothetical protein